MFLARPSPHASPAGRPFRAGPAASLCSVGASAWTGAGERAGWRLGLTPLGAQRSRGGGLLQLLLPLASHEVPVVWLKWPWASTRLCGGGRCLARALGARTHLSESRKVPAFSSLLFWPDGRPERSRWKIGQRGDSSWIGWGVFGYFSCGGDSCFFFFFFRHFIGSLFTRYQFLGSQLEITFIKLPFSGVSICVGGEEEGEEEAVGKAQKILRITQKAAG